VKIARHLNGGSSSLALFAIATTLGLAACSPATIATGKAPPASDLTGTQWVLIGSSPDGSAETLSEVTPYAYTLQFQASGYARFKFDCNQGTASWKAVPAGNGGQISFGPITVTSTLCAPGSVGGRVATDMAKAAQYHIYDGRLTLTLDEGMPAYVWERVD
jgi:heat shock protein HslJ